MEIRYQLIFKIILAWNMTYYKRIRNLSLQEVEIFINSPLLPEMVKAGKYADRIEVIPISGEYDPNYLIRTKTINLCDFKIPTKLRLLKMDEITEAFHWLRNFIKAPEFTVNNLSLLN